MNSDDVELEGVSIFDGTAGDLGGDDYEDVPAAGEYELVNSIDVIFTLRPWHTAEVRVLRDSIGRPLAFASVCAIGDACRERTGLPTEFFNHQLKDLDYDDADKLAAFMTEYGMIAAPDPLRVKPRLRTAPFGPRDPYEYDSIASFEASTGYRAAGCEYSLLVSDEKKQEVSLHYAELKAAVADTEKRLEEAQPEANILTKRRIHTIVSYETVVRAYEDWLFCVRHIQALLQYKTVPELARLLGEDEMVVARNCLAARDMLQKRLSKVSPKLDILCIEDGESQTLSKPDEPGSFEEALALQIWNFTLEAKGGFTTCKECGNVFVHKQAKGLKGKSRTTSLFCCDRCKNRYAQRTYRKTDGYRLKMEKRSAAKGK